MAKTVVSLIPGSYFRMSSFTSRNPSNTTHTKNVIAKVMLFLGISDFHIGIHLHWLELLEKNK